MAIVGDQVITVDEFRYNYELGYSHLKSGKNRKKTYLDYMIKEKLLSLEGYRLGLDKLEQVKNAEAALIKELLIEALLEKEVKNKISVTTDEIKEAINQSKVSFKFRYWFEPTFERAKSVAEAMMVRGYTDVLDEILYENPERSINPEHLETDYLNYLQISPELLVAIKDLPYGDISEPVELNDQYYIFQVLDIRRKGITENEYTDKASSFEQVIFYRKLEKALVEYGTNLLEPKSIVTKRKAFNLLAEAILEWKQIETKYRPEFMDLIYESDSKYPAAKKLVENLESPFVEYKEGIISTEEFINQFDTNRFLREFKDKKEFLNFLHTRVAQNIRDYFLVREAEENELGNQPKVQKELTLWRNKWVYSELRSELLKEISIDDKDVKKYYNHFKNRYQDKNKYIPSLTSIYKQVKKDTYQEKMNHILNTKIESLKNQYKIQINEAVLDTITVVDFEKSRWATVQVFKYGSNRPAFPVVDPSWGNIGIRQ